MTNLERELYRALLALRGLVKEGVVPRYTVTPGAALNSVIEEMVDPALVRFDSVLMLTYGIESKELTHND